MPPQKTAGGGPRNKMTITCAEQGRKQAPSAKQNKVEAVAAAKWQWTDVTYAYTAT